MLKCPRALEVIMRNIDKLTFSIIVFILAIGLPRKLYSWRHRLIWIPAVLLSIIAYFINSDPTEIIRYAIGTELIIFTLTSFKNEVKND